MKILKIFLPLAVSILVLLSGCESPSEIEAPKDIETIGENVKAYITDFTIEQNGIEYSFKVDSSDIRIDFTKKPPVIRKFKLHFSNNNPEVSEQKKLIVEKMRIYLEMLLLTDEPYKLTNEMDSYVGYDLDRWTDPAADSTQLNASPKNETEITFKYLKNEKLIIANLFSVITDRVVGKNYYYDADQDINIVVEFDKTEVLLINTSFTFTY